VSEIIPIPAAYKFWRQSLAGDQAAAAAIHTDRPECGFWRASRRTKEGHKVRTPLTIVPTETYDADGAVWGVIGVGDARKTLDHQGVCRIWQYAGEAITEELYRAVAEQGENWPDIDATVAAQVDPPSRHGVGGNNPPDDPAEILREQIESAKAGAPAYATIGDDETLARAQSLRSRLLELSGEAKKTHKKLKDPHWDRCKEIDAKWLPLARDAEEAAKAIRAAMDAWDTEKHKRDKAAREAAEKAQREAEEKARGSDIALAALGVQAPEFAPPPPAAPTVVKPAYGRATSSKVVRVVTTIDDWAALFNHFKDRTEVQDVLRKLAQRAVTDGHDVPGVTIDEQKKFG
jgi:hypothetical protein